MQTKLKQFFKNNYWHISDTLMDGINYERIVDTFTNNYRGKMLHYKQIGYIRCDKKNLILQLDKPINRKLGCPVVRVDATIFNSKFGNSYGMDFIRDTLTNNERKIFENWQKND